MNQTDIEASCVNAGAEDFPEGVRPRRILIVDNHPVVRLGLMSIMKGAADLTVCGEAETVNDARAAIAQLGPDAVICDISLNQFEGIELVRTVRAHHPLLPILVLSTQDEALYAERMLSVGANGYIMKDASGEVLLTALRRVLGGQPYVSAAVGNSIVLKHTKKRVEATDPMERLSTRELQILLMIGKGLSTRETAHALHLSVKTIESHRQRIRNKLNLRNGSQLLRFAMADIHKTV
ncbi:MAG TPA: response regulator transcription factor [Steroidobacteraceae bacterium]|jgi:DNA-binding NarL/FixJ family response regulator